MNNRDDKINGFLSQNGWNKNNRNPLADDASYRRYERLTDGVRQVVLMDAPPEYEDVDQFIFMANYLRSLGTSAPNIIAIDRGNGFLLIEDFGDNTYARVLEKSPESERFLYILAVDTLIHLHKFSIKGFIRKKIKPYDIGSIIDEACIILDWYCCKLMGGIISKNARSLYRELWENQLSIIAGQPQNIVLKDFHVDNLMLLKGRDEISACGLLDFQDAVYGPGIYDLMSLLEDARRDIHSNLVKEMKNRYFSAISKSEYWCGQIDKFEETFSVLGASRHAKVIGIFSRLAIQDKKQGYLIHIPRVWRLLENSLKHPKLGRLKQWFDEYIPVNQRQSVS